MIDEVDESIRALVRRDALNGDAVDVAFDVPSKEWAAKRSKPTINVYLFDVREDLSRRQVELGPIRDGDGRITGRKRPPRRFKLSYLVTAWTQRPEDEHRLLATVLHTFLPHEEFPRDALQGSLSDLDLPLIITIGAPPPPERSIGEIWNALGGELKPSVELTVTVPVDPARILEAGPPVLEEPRIAISRPDGTPETPPRTRAAAVARAVEATASAEETVIPGKDDKGRVLRFNKLEPPR